MNQLTLRGFDSSLKRRLEQLAREREISLNRAALLLLRRGAGLETTANAAGAIGNALDSFVGVWTEEDEREFLDSIESLERVDPDFWS